MVCYNTKEWVSYKPIYHYFLEIFPTSRKTYRLGLNITIKLSYIYTYINLMHREMSEIDFYQRIISYYVKNEL